MTTRWNPVREMITLREAMDNAFNQYRPQSGYSSRNYVWQIPVDAYVTADALVLTADVPGLAPDALEIKLEGDILTIRGELPQQKDQEFILHERPSGKFERVLTINTPIDSNKVEAVFENGVLTLTLPKAEAVKPKQIQIKAK